MDCPREVLVRVRVPSHYAGNVEREVRIAYAIDLYVRGIVSVEHATELAGVSLHDFLAELRRREIAAYPYSDGELREELGLV
jgi:predicted HTH domain antitoxin